jgi:hypothetical protein
MFSAQARATAFQCKVHRHDGVLLDDAGQHPYRDHRDNREFQLAPFRQSCTIWAGPQAGLLDYVTNLYTSPPHGGLEADLAAYDFEKEQIRMCRHD